MSILLVVSVLSLFVLLLTCISIFLTLHFYSKPINHRSSANTPNYTAFLTTARLRSAWNLLLQHTIFSHDYYPNDHMINCFKLPVKRYERDPASEGPEDCGVCLCEIEEGEDIRDLRCDHLFHKVCLDGWMASGQTMCPLCRGPLAPPAMVAEDGAEVLLFQFFSFNCNRHDDNWWLR
ncbi:hypothetical protein Ancab_020989 [Ancistrocladus abbreviatus]